MNEGFKINGKTEGSNNILVIKGLPRNLGPLRRHRRCRRAQPAFPPDRDLPNNPNFKGGFLLVHADVVGAFEPFLTLHVVIAGSGLVNVLG